MSKSPSISAFIPPNPVFLTLPPHASSLFRDNLHEESKIQTTNNRRTPEVPTSLDDRRPSKAHTDIKSQMSHAVNGMEDKGPSDEELEAALDGHRQSGGGGDKGSGLEVPAHEGSGEVSDGGSIQSAGEAGAGDALPRRTAEPGLLLVVDLEMGGDGAGETLLGEKSGGIGGGDLVGLEGSGLDSKGSKLEDAARGSGDPTKGGGTSALSNHFDDDGVDDGGVWMVGG